jgi:hypothetical protein
MANTIPRVALKNLAAQQLPEFVRAEYPTFVSFVEAYYEFLDNQGVDLKQVRDIDETLEDYIKFFKAELAHNYPVVSTDTNTERFLLKHIKEQYLAKGSEASYKLLFRLLYGKDVFIDYPGRQMLRVSDGRWTQDVSIFVQVAQGNPLNLVGKNINIQTGKKIYNTNVVSGVDSFAGVTASVQNAVVVNEALGVWELFLDRNFYGEISPNNTVKYGSEFQATILPNTAKIKINEPGRNFRPGMVFQLNTGEGTPFWFKVATVDENGGLKTIDTIKFGLFYNTSFAVTVLPGSAVTSKKKRTTTVSDLTYTVASNGKIVDFTILNGGMNYQIAPLVEVTGNGTGALAHTVIENGSITEIIIDDFGSGYTGEVYAQITNAPGDVLGNGASVKPIIGADYSYKMNDKTDGFTESGYVNYGDYWTHAYSDGTYVGTIARQFFINAQDTQGTNPAILNVSLEAVSKYPGYYKTNDGFLDDSMMIQDSYYFQAFAYVLKIDEQLQSYASVVRSMLHPSGMAMFGEYSINNKIALAVGLTSLVKSLGVTIYDTIIASDDYELDSNGNVIRGTYFKAYKYLETEYDGNNITDVKTFLFTKAVNDSYSTTEVFNKVFTKSIGATGQAETVFMIETVGKYFGKTAADTTQLVENYTKLLTTKKITDFQPIGEQHAIAFTLNTINDPMSGMYPESGYVTLEPYDLGSYQAEWYANTRPSTFSS